MTARFSLQSTKHARTYTASTAKQLVLIKSLEKRWILEADFSVNSKTQIVPATNPIAVMQRCRRCVSVVNERFVIAAAGANRTGPTRVAVVSCADVMRIEKRV